MLETLSLLRNLVYCLLNDDIEMIEQLLSSPLSVRVLDWTGKPLTGCLAFLLFSQFHLWANFWYHTHNHCTIDLLYFKLNSKKINNMDKSMK